MKQFDMKTWERRELAEYFRGFMTSRYDVGALVDAARLYQFARDTGRSFYLCTLYCLMRATNAVPEFRQRIVGDQVVEFDSVGALAAIMNKGDNIFREMQVPFAPTLAEWHAQAAAIRDETLSSGRVGMALTDTDREFLPFATYSCAPWVHFSAMAGAVRAPHQTQPVFVWGKTKQSGAALLLPLSMQLSHILVDGVHCGRFFAALEEGLAAPDSL
ncbi:chloramphenicol acetyltransferase [Alphaproteobacteria bacterium]|nr:chloramphenicol acetyltransferase [Alphaproteobacteria bacterium]